MFSVYFRSSHSGTLQKLSQIIRYKPKVRDEILDIYNPQHQAKSNGRLYKEIMKSAKIVFSTLEFLPSLEM